VLISRANHYNLSTSILLYASDFVELALIFSLARKTATLKKNNF